MKLEILIYLIAIARKHTGSSFMRHGYAELLRVFAMTEGHKKL